jgi:hypothetical protein
MDETQIYQHIGEFGRHDTYCSKSSCSPTTFSHSIRISSRGVHFTSAFFAYCHV